MTRQPSPRDDLRLVLLIGAWKLGRYEDAERTESFANYVRLVKKAEDAGIHGIFLADALNYDPASSRNNRFDPTVLAAAFGSVTSRIHLVTTVSTSFHHPYSVARYISSIAHVTDDRIGINLVTSFAGERNFGSAPLPEPAARYRRLEEFHRVLVGLWDADPDEPEERQRIDHHAEFFDVDGPLSTRPPRRRPGVGQAGTSAPGVEFASRHADFVYTAQPTRQVAERYYDRLRTRAEANRPDGTRPTVLTGVTTIIGDTEAEALDIERAIASDLYADRALRKLEDTLGGADLSGLGLDERIPLDRIPDPSTITRRQGRAEIFRSLIADERLTLREVLEAVGRSNGHLTVAGTAAQVADVLADRFTAGTTDGFVFSPPSNGELADAVIDRLVPELQERGHAVPYARRGESFAQAFRSYQGAGRCEEAAVEG